MIWDSAINSFITGSKPGSASEYKTKLRIFHEYLIERYSIKDNNYDKIVGCLSPEEILESVDSYIVRDGRKKIESCSPVRVYLTAVLEYLKFIYSNNNYQIKNDFINDQQKQKDLRAAFDLLLKNRKLKESEADVHITQEECEALISKCNLYIDVQDDELIRGDAYNKKYSKFLSAIILKFVLAFGTSSETLNNLKLYDYNFALNSVKINGYSVRLPDSLALQMQKYVCIRNEVVAEIDKDRLFVKRQGSSAKRSAQHNKLNSSVICDVLNEVTGKKSVRSVAKHAIIEMIKAGIPQYLITNFTGYSYEIYNYCLDIANDEPSIGDNSLLDSRLRLLKSYEML